MSNLSKLITPVSEADKAAFDKITQERTSFDAPPLTPIEEVENLLRGIEDTLRMAAAVINSNKGIDFSGTYGETEAIQDALIQCRIGAMRFRKNKGAAL